jgi:hypothetical protein
MHGTMQRSEAVAAGAALDLQFHPVADIFPLLDGDDFAALVEDIRQHGVREPITTFEGKILDGRIRYRACLAAGVDLISEPLPSGVDPLGFVISKNLHRRHLNESQRAMAAAKLANMRQGERTDLKPSANLQKVKVAQADAAALLNVSVRTVASAAKVRNLATPELIKAVEQGKLAASVAARIAHRDPELQRMVVERINDGSDAYDAILAAARQKREDDERKADQARRHAMTQERVRLDAERGAPVAMLGDRPVRIERDPATQEWTLEIGPNIDHKTYEERWQQIARDAGIIDDFLRKRDDLLNTAEALEAEAQKLETKARRLRSKADVLEQQTQDRIIELYQQQYGEYHSATEFLRFQADAATDAELAALPQDQRAERLIAAHVAACENGDHELDTVHLARRGYRVSWRY